ncbi:MAG: hypothetical protein HYY16_11855 [Planctomycetes bacterium]|nr:hypothetical protein [Planctomycetota bacterium]
MRTLPLLTLLALASCTSLEGLYDRAALEGPLANMSGTWMATAGPYMLTLHQEGETIRGSWRDISADRDRTWGSLVVEATTAIEGTVRGRVLKAQSVLGGSTHMVVVAGYQGVTGFLLAFTLAPDGASAEAVVNLVTYDGTSAGIWKTPMARFAQRAPEDPALAGGIVCTLPVAGDGSVPGLTEHASSVRDVFIALHYTRDVRGDVMPSRVLIPTEAPRRVSWIHYPGPGLYAGLLDRGTLLGARSGRHPQGETALDGQPCWWVLAPGWDEGAADLTPTKFVAELYRENPAGGAMPFEVVDAARRQPDGSWQSTHGYLWTAQTLTCARAVIEDGRPARVEIYAPEEPPLEDFLVATDKTVAMVRWRTRGLIAVKNRTLPSLLRERKTSELTTLVEKIEQVMLDVNHEVERGKDAGQKQLEEGTGDASEARVWVIAYQERIEILKPILAAIKEEIANRNK